MLGDIAPKGKWQVVKAAIATATASALAFAGVVSAPLVAIAATSTDDVVPFDSSEVDRYIEVAHFGDDVVGIDQSRTGYDVKLDGSSLAYTEQRGDSRPGTGIVTIKEWTGPGKGDYSTTTVTAPAESQGFGYALDIDHEAGILVVGARYSQEVFVYQRELGSWESVPSVITAAESKRINDTGSFGESVSISDSHIVIGAPNSRVDNKPNAGAVYVTTVDEALAGDVHAQAMLLPTGKVNAQDLYGQTVAAEGARAAVSAPQHGVTAADGSRYQVGRVTAWDLATAAETFSVTPDVNQRGVLFPLSDEGETWAGLGRSLAITDDGRIIAGSPSEIQFDGDEPGDIASDKTTSQGAIYVYSEDGTFAGKQTSPLAHQYYFGASVDFNNETREVFVGSLNLDAVQNKGNVQVFDLKQPSLFSVAKPLATQAGQESMFGTFGILGGSVQAKTNTDSRGVSHNRVVVSSSGGVYVFESLDALTLTKVTSLDPLNASPSAREGRNQATYTVVFKNTTGAFLSELVVVDDLSNVLDDAAISNVASTKGNAVLDGHKLTWSGDLDVDQTVTITYTATVHDAVVADDTDVQDFAEPVAALVNTVSATQNVNGTTQQVPTVRDEADAPVRDKWTQGVEVTTPIDGALKLDKKVTDDDGNGAASAGETLKYTITAENVGGLLIEDAEIADDLSGLLDLTGDPENIRLGFVDRDGQPLSAPDTSFESPILSWHGDFPAGAKLTISYDLTLKSATEIYPLDGERVLRNSVVSPQNIAPEGPETSTPLEDELLLEKAAMPMSGSKVQPGDEITYALTITNKDANFAKTDVTVTDDLSAVLPYTEIVGEPTQGATISGTTLTWTGDVEAASTVEINYTVRVLEGAPHGALIGNLVSSADVRENPPVTEHTVENPRGTVSLAKSANPSTGTQVSPGQTISYTVTVTNDGDAPLRNVTVEDTISGPATVDRSTLPQGASLEGTTIVWRGDVPAHETVTLNYDVTVNADAAAPAVIGNVVVSPDMANDPDDPVHTEHPVRTVELEKTADPATGTTVASGDIITYTVAATNPSAVDFSDVEVIDDLTAVLNNATLIEPAQGAEFDPVTKLLTWRGELLAGHTITLEYRVRVNDVIEPEGATLRNLLSSPDSPQRPVTEHITENDRGTVSLAKGSAPESGSVVRPGDKITYTVTVENDTPRVIRDVRVLDDVTDVLKNASIDIDSLPSGMILTGNELVWVGDVPGGQKVTLEYTAEVNADATAPAIIRNAVTSEDMSNRPDEVPSTEHHVGTVSLSKASDPESGSGVKAGDTVTYTVTVKNDAAVRLTGVSVRDDLSDVLDHATLVGDPTNGATLDGTSLEWTGDLLAHESVEIAYSVRVNDGVVDGALRNVVTSADSPDEPKTVHEVGSISLAKSVSVPEQFAASRGEVVTYAVTVSNTSGVEVRDAKFVDNLADVLDNAELVEGSLTVVGSGEATIEQTKLTWIGDLPQGGAATVTYSVRVLDDVPAGESLRNVVSSPFSGEDSSTDTPIGVVSLSKSSTSSPAGAVKPGSEVAYTITVSNPSDTDIKNVTVYDNLNGVLGHAELKTSPHASSGNLSLNGGDLQWNGDVAANSDVTITYTVIVKDKVEAPATLRNFVTSPDSPDTPETADPVGTLDLSKTTNVDDGSPVRIGDEVTYKITATNKSGTDLEGVLIEDDLSDVLDNATLIEGPSNGALIDGTKLTWVGDVRDGHSVEFEYTVKVNDSVAGKQTLRNAVTSPDSPDVPETSNPIGSVDLAKTSNPATGAGVKPGDTVTYSVTITNASEVDMADIVAVDDLSGVLANARLQGDPVVSGGGDVEVNDSKGTLTWRGDIAAGDVVTVEYSVLVNEDVESGQTLKNVVTSSDSPTTPSTENPVASVSLKKSVLPQSGTAVRPNDEVKYTITASNASDVDAHDVSISDELTDVLDDADLVDGSIVVSDGSTASLLGTTIVWNGTVAAHSSITISYSAKVHAGATAPASLRNVVTSPHSPDQPETENPVGTLLLSKSNNMGDGTVVKPGEIVQYTVRITNPAMADLEEITVTDDLSDVLNNSTWEGDATSSAGALKLEGTHLNWTGSVPAQGIVTFTYSVRMSSTVVAPATIRNVVTSVDSPSVPSVENPVGTVKLLKTSIPASGESVRPGQKVSYSIIVSNPAKVDQNLVTVTDDLSEVLNSAKLSGEPTASDGSMVTVSGNTLVWTGTVPAQDRITIEYVVTVNADAVAPAVLKNSVTSPDSVDVPQTENPVGTIELGKSVSPQSGTSVKAGDIVEYSVTIKNPVNAGVFDVLVQDDLSGVLGSADLIEPPTSAEGSVSFDPQSQVVAWRGDLAAHQSVVVKYSVKVKDDVSEGDYLRNVVTSSDSPQSPATENPVGDLTFSKRLLDGAGNEIPSGIVVAPGQVVTYEITAKNAKNAAETVAIIDDLSDVLDDAALETAPTAEWTASGTVPELSFANNKLSWSHDLPANSVLTIRYSVKTNSKAQGAEILRNSLNVNGEEGPGTEHPVGTLDLSKTVTPTDGVAVKPGEKVTYVVSLTNVSDIAVKSVRVSDDLRDVLDNATLLGGVEVSDGSSAAVKDGQLEWTGDVPARTTVTLTYTVKVDVEATAPAVLRNAVTSPNSPDTPTTENPVGTVTLEKESTPSAGTAVKPGSEVEYLVTVANTTDVTVFDVSVTDDLADVVDDATLDVSSVQVSDGSSAAVFDGRIVWNGNIEANSVITIRYTVTVNDSAQAPSVLRNLVTSPDSPDAPETSNPVGTLKLTKSSNPGTGSAVKPGDIVEYSVTIQNDSNAPILNAQVVDDLSDVLDDATLKGSVHSTAGKTKVKGSDLIWTGDVSAHTTVTITYRVVVNADSVAPATLKNVVSSADSPTAPETENPVAAVTLNKSVHPGADVAVKPGDFVDYTVTVTNPGAVDLFGVYVEDNLSDVLDDAQLVGDPVVSDGSKTVLNGLSLTWTGDIPAGQTIVITYRAKVLEGAQAPATLRNSVTSPHSPDESETRNPVGTVSLHKVSDPESGTAVDGGDVVTYTIVVGNSTDHTITGVVVTDDLSDVLDDAELVGEQLATGGEIVSIEDSLLTWMGTVAAHSSVEVTYSVKVSDETSGNSLLKNVVMSPHSADTKTTDNPISDDVPVVDPPDEGTLPVTGSDVAGIVVGALALLLAGALLRFVVRRKRGEEEHV